MKGHLGALLTSGLAAVALALALLQAAVLVHSAVPPDAVQSARTQSHRYSVPGGRSGVPYLPFDKAQPATTPEGRSPEKQQEERHSPPPPRQRSFPPGAGPRPHRRAVA
jgi:hypothetical protein